MFENGMQQFGTLDPERQRTLADDRPPAEMAGLVALSIQSGVLSAGTSLEEMVRDLRDAGFNWGELSIGHSYDLSRKTAKEWKSFRIFAESEGLLFRQGHLKNGIDLSSSDKAKRRDAIDILKRECEFYAELGITAGVVHPGGWEMIYDGVPAGKCLDARCLSLQELEAFTRDMPVTVCLENLPDTAPDAPALLEMTRLAGVEKIGYCLDTGHLNLTTSNPGEFIGLCGKKLLALHLHDNRGSYATSTDSRGYWYPDDLHTFPGFHQNAVNWKEVREALKKINYTGLWNFEIGGELTALPTMEMRRLRLRHYVEMGHVLFSNGW